MTVPFYVSPQQVLADRAEYARKGIARGRSIVAMQVSDGILFVAENSMPSLHKVAEIYDRIAFAAVGRYNEFEALRVAGVRRADLTGYSYSREDVTARTLAGVYSQSLGQIFTQELKPMEVEILVAEVGRGDAGSNGDAMYRVTYDGQITDETGFMTLGGASGELAEKIDDVFEENLPSGKALKLAVEKIAEQTQKKIATSSLEVAMLDRGGERRCFRRIEGAELVEMLGTDEVVPSELQESKTSGKATDKASDNGSDG